MKHNHNSARCLVSRVSFRGISLILALGLLLESCHGIDHPLVPGSKIHQDTKVKLPIKQRDSREQILQEKEDQLLGKAFKTRQGYIVKFYKEEGLWRANIVEEIGIFRSEFDLPAYLGEDEDLAENIERLLFNEAFKWYLEAASSRSTI